MKQNITKEQLNELSNEQFNKLYDWFEKKYPERFPHGTQFLLESSEKTLSRTLDIGRMIEFLAENTTRAEDTLAIDAGEHQWHVYHLNKPGNTTAPELCDALWEACKEVLERQS